MKPIERYRKYGLDTPITFKAGTKFHLLFWGGGSFLLAGGLVAISIGDIFEKIIGIIGIIFFGFALFILLVAFLKSRQRGLFEISNNGIYMSHIGIDLPWDDIGPAWIFTFHHKGGKAKDLLFVLRNVSTHTAKMKKLPKILMNLSKKVAHNKPGGTIEWGVKSILFAADADSKMHDQLSNVLEKMRKSVIHDNDSTVYNIPIPFRLGVPAEDLLAIINSEVLNRNNAFDIR